MSENQICITCHLPIRDAVAAATCTAGTFQVLLRDGDVAQIRDQHLVEVALPFLGTQRHPSRVALTLHGPPLADVNVQLRALRDRLAQIRDVAELAERPSWDALTALAAHDPDTLYFSSSSQPPDVRVGEREQDELGADATTAVALVTWARRLTREVTSYAESLRQCSSSRAEQPLDDNAAEASAAKRRRDCITDLVQRAPDHVRRCLDKAVLLDWLPDWLPGHLMRGDATPTEPDEAPRGPAPLHFDSSRDA